MTIRPSIAEDKNQPRTRTCAILPETNIKTPQIGRKNRSNSLNTVFVATGLWQRRAAPLLLRLIAANQTGYCVMTAQITGTGAMFRSKGSRSRLLGTKM